MGILIFNIEHFEKVIIICRYSRVVMTVLCEQYIYTLSSVSVIHFFSELQYS